MREGLPHNKDAEMRLLGEMLCNLQCLNEVACVHPKLSEYFYDDRHRAIYEAIARANDTSLLAVQKELLASNMLEAVGGLPYVASLQGQAVGILPEANRAAELLQVEYVRRRLLEASYSMMAGAKDKPVEEALESAERNVLDISASLQTDSDPDIKSLMIQAIEEMEEAVQNKGKLRGVGIGYPDFDHMTKGLRPGQLVILAARPGVGKTSLAMNIAEHVAVDQKQPTGVFSLEMVGMELALRMACARARVNSELVQSGHVTEGDKAKLTRAMTAISNAPLFICEKSGLTISQISTRARRMHQRNRLRLIVVDYLQLIYSKRENRVAQITEISGGLKTLAKDLKVPIIALSQLSRDCEKEDREPRLSDLRDSGSIEQDADIVVILAPQGDPKDDPQKVFAKVPKHRGGRVGKVELNFFKGHTRFESVAKTAGVPTE